MSQFIRQIFSTPLLVGVAPNVEVRDEICKLAYEFKTEAENAGLVSEGWDLNAKSSRQEDYNKYGVTSYYSKNLLNDEKWFPVIGFIHDFSAAMISTVYDGKDSVILNMWTTIYPQGAFVPSHIHDNSLLSGVFYAKAKPNCGNLIFEDPAHIAKNMSSRGANVFPTLPTRHTQEVEDGMMVLFPSWLPHQTQPNKSGEDRIIISFNVGFKRNALEETMGGTV